MRKTPELTMNSWQWKKTLSNVLKCWAQLRHLQRVHPVQLHSQEPHFRNFDLRDSPRNWDVLVGNTPEKHRKTMFGWYGNTRTPHGQLYNALTTHVWLSPPVDAVVSFASRSTSRWVTVQYEGIANPLDLLDLVGPAYRSPWSFVHKTIIGGNSKITIYIYIY
jgi:hypothetical protein